MIPAIKRSTLMDRHLGGPGGLICLQQHASSLVYPESARPCRPEELLARQALQQALLTTPRQRTNYFNLPSLNLTQDKMKSGGSTERLATLIMQGSGSQTARNLDSNPEVENARESGSETARDMRKIEIAKESIVNSLKGRMKTGGATHRNNGSAGREVISSSTYNQ